MGKIWLVVIVLLVMIVPVYAEEFGYNYLEAGENLNPTTTETSNVTNLSQLNDVNIPTPSDDDVLTWDAAAQLWIAKAFAAATGGRWNITGSVYLVNNSEILDVDESVLSAFINSTGDDRYVNIEGDNMTGPLHSSATGMPLNISGVLYVNESDRFVGIGRPPVDLFDVYEYRTDNLQTDLRFTTENPNFITSAPTFSLSSINGTHPAQVNQTLGRFQWTGTDATGNRRTAGMITGRVDGIPGAGVPGEFAFKVYDAANVAHELLTLKGKNQRIGLGEIVEPESFVHAYQGDAGVHPLATNYFTWEDDINTGFNILTPNTRFNIIAFGDTQDSNAGQITYRHPTNEFNINTNGVLAMTIDSGGRMGLGTSSGTQPQRLVVVGDANVTDDLFVTDKVSIGTTTQAHKLNVLGSTNLSGILYAGNRTLYVNKSRVGIGVILPTAKLDVFEQTGYGLNVTGAVTFTNLNTTRDLDPLTITNHDSENNWIIRLLNYIKENVFTVDNHGNVETKGNMTTNQFYGEMWNYTSAGYLLNIDLAGVYYNVTGLAPGELNGFTFSTSSSATGGSVLTTNVSGLYSVSGTLSFSSQAVGGMYGISLAHNHDQNTHRDCYSRITAATSTGNVGMSCLMDLEMGDNITLMIESENIDRDVTIYTANIKAVRVGKIP